MVKTNSIESVLGKGVSLKPALSLDELRNTTPEQCNANNAMLLLKTGGVLEVWYFDSQNTANDDGVSVVKSTAMSGGRWLKSTANSDAKKLDGKAIDYFQSLIKQGSGGGFDADMLDGKHAADFLLANAVYLGSNYAVLSGGLIVQWGVNICSTENWINFPIAFPHTCFAVVVTEANASGWDRAAWTTVHGVSGFNNTAYVGYVRGVSAGNISGTSASQQFIAVGY